MSLTRSFDTPSTISWISSKCVKPPVETWVTTSKSVRMSFAVFRPIHFPGRVSERPRPTSSYSDSVISTFSESSFRPFLTRWPRSLKEMSRPVWRVLSCKKGDFQSKNGSSESGMSSSKKGMAKSTPSWATAIPKWSVSRGRTRGTFTTIPTPRAEVDTLTLGRFYALREIGATAHE